MKIESALDLNATKSKSRLGEALKISLPIMASQFLLMIGGFISNLMLSRVDDISFAAGLLINAVQLSLILVIFGVLYALSPLIGKVMGEGTRPEQVGQMFLAGCSLSLLICLPTIALLFFIKPILLVLGQPLSLVEATNRYFYIYLWAVPAVGLTSVYLQLLLGIMKQGIVFLYSICNLFVSTILSYVLIFGKLGLPALGIEGLAWAALITSWLAALFLGSFIVYHPSHRSYALLNFKFNLIRQHIKKILNVGLPISMQMGTEIFSFFITTIMVGWISIEALEVQQVATRYLFLLVIPIVGLSQAATVVVSRFYGAEKLGEAKQAGQDYMRMGWLYSFIVLVAFALFPNIFIQIFIENRPDNQAIYQLLAIILVLIALGQIFDAVRNILTGALRGLQDTKFPMQVSMVMIWPVGLPLAYVMGFTLDGGLIGITLAHDIVMAIGCGILYWRWKNRFKQF